MTTIDADDLEFPPKPDWEPEELLFGLEEVPVTVLELLLATVVWPDMSVRNEKRL